MTKRIVIDPVTRLEGHGRIEIILDENGNVADAFWQVLELRGFERFCIGRPAVEMTRIAPNICGICPSAHHMAACKALDMLYGVEPPPAARLIRELEYHASIVDDHLLHFFFLAAPDFIVGPDADPAERNIFGVLGRLGAGIAEKVFRIRRRNRDVIALLFSKAAHPEGGLPGGVPRGVRAEERQLIMTTAKESVAFILEVLELFREMVLGSKVCRELIDDEAFSIRCNSMALVDPEDKAAFYDGVVKVVDSDGHEIDRFNGVSYAEKIAEWVLPWTTVKMTYLRDQGWHGIVEGDGSGLFKVGPLARLAVAEGMATPLAQEELCRFKSCFGAAPATQILASHWARLICALQAAERNLEISAAPMLTDSIIRNHDMNLTFKGIGCVEAPRGTLFHHYETDERGLLTSVNLLVATQNNAGPISVAVKKAAVRFIREGEVREGLLNRVEMAFRAFDPCQSCATHALPGRPGLSLNIRDHKGRLLRRVSR